MVGRQLASALPLRCVPVVRRQLQRPPPSQIRPCPLGPQKRHEIHAPSGDMRVLEEHIIWKNNIGLAEREILALVVHIMLLKVLRTEASRQLLIARITLAGLTPPSPRQRPCLAWL
jgi:hypothetical protein